MEQRLVTEYCPVASNLSHGMFSETISNTIFLDIKLTLCHRNADLTQIPLVTEVLKAFWSSVYIYEIFRLCLSTTYIIRCGIEQREGPPLLLGMDQIYPPYRYGCEWALRASLQTSFQISDIWTWEEQCFSNKVHSALFWQDLCDHSIIGLTNRWLGKLPLWRSTLEFIPIEAPGSLRKETMSTKDQKESSQIPRLVEIFINHESA